MTTEDARFLLDMVGWLVFIILLWWPMDRALRKYDKKLNEALLRMNANWDSAQNHHAHLTSQLVQEQVKNNCWRVVARRLVENGRPADVDPVLEDLRQRYGAQIDLDFRHEKKGSFEN